MPCPDPHHYHARWPTSGKQQLRIEACERQCGWCEYKIGDRSTASNLRKHAQKHIANDESLQDVLMVASKAGRPRVSRKSRAAAIRHASDEPFVIDPGPDTSPDKTCEDSLDSDEQEHARASTTRSGSVMSLVAHLEDFGDMILNTKASNGAYDQIASLTLEKNELIARVQLLEAALEELRGRRVEGSRHEIWHSSSTNFDTAKRVRNGPTDRQPESTSCDSPSDIPSRSVLKPITKSNFGTHSAPSVSMDQTMAAHLSMKQALMDQGDDVPDFRSQRPETHTPVVSDSNGLHHASPRVDAANIIQSMRGDLETGASRIVPERTMYHVNTAHPNSSRFPFWTGLTPSDIFRMDTSTGVMPERFPRISSCDEQSRQENKQWNYEDEERFPFSCTAQGCDKAFGLLGEMKRHFRLKHEGEGLIRISCKHEGCLDTFSRRSDLRWHMEEEHGQEK